MFLCKLCMYISIFVHTIYMYICTHISTCLIKIHNRQIRRLLNPLLACVSSRETANRMHCSTTVIYFEKYRFSRKSENAQAVIQINQTQTPSNYKETLVIGAICHHYHSFWRLSFSQPQSIILTMIQAICILCFSISEYVQIPC